MASIQVPKVKQIEHQNLSDCTRLTNEFLSSIADNVTVNEDTIKLQHFAYYRGYAPTHINTIFYIETVVIDDTAGK